MSLYMFVAEFLSSVDINVGVSLLVIYFLTCYIDLLSAWSMYSFHFLVHVYAISCIYWFAFTLYIALSTSAFVHLYILCKRLTLHHTCVKFSFHQCLLCKHGLFQGFTAFSITALSLSAKLSTSVAEVIGIIGDRYHLSMWLSSFQFVLL